MTVAAPPTGPPAGSGSRTAPPVVRPRRRPESLGRTPAFDRWANHVTVAVVVISGIAFAWMKWLLEPPPEVFSVVNHPWQPAMLDAHVLSAPLLLLAIGLLLRPHVVARLRNRAFRRSRRTGIVLAAILGPVIASGYLLQTAAGEGTRRALLIVHLGGGAIWVLAHVGHAIAARRRMR